MTSEQREAAITLMWGAMSHDAQTEAEELADMGHALDALLTGFVVIAKDDVIERFGSNNAGERSRRLVTRWEPITNEDVGPWTTQETP